MLTFVIGCNYRTAPLKLRERLAFSADQAHQALRSLHEQHPGCEALLLSTCNRVELYLAGPQASQRDGQEAMAALARSRGIDPAELAGALYQHRQAEAVRHCFRVASSLDSMVPGESQIVAQVKQALAVADGARTLGPVLRGLFDRALVVAKRIRSETAIASGRASLGSLAVDFARQIFARLADKTVLMVGAGKIGQVTLRHIIAQQPRRVLVTSRNLEHATATARKLGAEAVDFDHLADHLAGSDIVITCTGAASPIITDAVIAPALQRRQYQPILIIDIAVPRDVDPAVGRRQQIYLYNIDDLQTMVDHTLAQRRNQLTACEAIVAAEMLDFLHRQQSRWIAPVVSALSDKLERIAEQELLWALPKLCDDPDRNRQIIQHFKHRLIQKILHLPISRLKDQARQGRGSMHAEALRQLFDLPDKE